MSRRVTFVTPRYGDEVVGGAEGGARSLATRFAAEGWRVDVITSCAVSSVDWADHYEPGSTVEHGVQVHRHRVARPRHADFDRLSDSVLAAPSSVGRERALRWIDDQGPDSPDLLDAVAMVDDGVLALYPYLYQPTVRGIEKARVPVVLHAAAHDEAPLHLPVFSDVFAAAGGLAHHSRAEQQLVDRIFPATRTTPQVVLGLPVDEPAAGSAEPADEPTALYLGRVDRGKGTDDLVHRFGAWRARGGRGRLLLAGPVVHRPPSVEGVTVLGRVDDEERWRLLRSADVLVNPSPHESFSLVVLEAWLAGTPALVNGWCGPLAEHCVRSGGGLWFLGEADFELCLDRLLARSGLNERLAAGGRRYVESEFAWTSVRDRYVALLERVDRRTRSVA